MQSSQVKQHPKQKDDQYEYDNEEFQSPSDDSYASKIEKLFNVNYDGQTYQNIELSTSEMRQMMKEVSKKLDEKIHKYYGLMGQKHLKTEDDLKRTKEKLQKQLQTNQKLIETQVTQINDIQLIDEEMGSNKRMDKQAQRLRQYFQTKKAMIQADKETRFSKGEMNKAGQYLARDLDSEKFYFRLNKIKQDIQYAMLKDRNLASKTEQLQKKYQQLQKKHDEMNLVYNQKIQEAQSQKLLIQDNKSFFAEFHSKKQLIQRKQQKQKKLQILKYNIQNTLMKVQSDVQKMRKMDSDQNGKISLIEERITSIQKDIEESKLKADIGQKMDQSMSIKNIDVLLKSKKEKNQSIMIRNVSQLSQSMEVEGKANPEMTESSILLKPNFKIKQLLTKSKSKITPRDTVNNKSMDFGRKLSKSNALKQLLEGIPSKVSSYDKRVLKWEPRKKSVDKSMKNPGRQTKKDLLQPITHEE